MNAQEIKKNMTQGEWATRTLFGEEHILNVSDEETGEKWMHQSAWIESNEKLIGELVYNEGTASQRTSSIIEYRANRLAITTAINNTYGKGIDPTRIDDLIFLLTRIIQTASIDAYKADAEKLLTEINIL